VGLRVLRCVRLLLPAPPVYAAGLIRVVQQAAFAVAFQLVLMWARITGDTFNTQLASGGYVRFSAPSVGAELQ